MFLLVFIYRKKNIKFFLLVFIYRKKIIKNIFSQKSLESFQTKNFLFSNFFQTFLLIYKDRKPRL